MGKAGKEGSSSPDYLSIKNRIVLFVGPEGSGKTTQAELFSQRFGMPLIALGGLFREMAQTDNTELGIACRELLKPEHGHLEQSIRRRIVTEHLKQDKYKNGFVMEGALRVQEEVDEFNDMLVDAGRAMPITVVYLRVPGWLGADRILSSDRKRKDDNLKNVIRRLTTHYSDIGKRMGTARKQWEFVTVSAMGEPKETHSTIIKSLAGMYA